MYVSSQFNSTVDRWGVYPSPGQFLLSYLVLMVCENLFIETCKWCYTVEVTLCSLEKCLLVKVLGTQYL